MGTKNVTSYDFICYLIAKEKDKKKLIGYHLVASDILIVSMPYLSFSYKNGIFHREEAIKLDPRNISLKEHLLFISGDPESKKFLSEEK